MQRLEPICAPRGKAATAPPESAEHTPFGDEPQTFDTFATLASNIASVEAALLFAAELQPFVAIVGPSGWGKTHLLEAVSHRMGRELGRGEARLCAASEWVGSSGRADPAAPLLLDNVQEALGRGRLRVPLRLALERRVRAGRPTMLSITADRADRSVRRHLPLAREWVVASVAPPSDSERRTIVRTIALTAGLRLCPCVENVFAQGLRGNGRTLRGALMRLKLLGPEWCDEPAALRACGVVNPFFADNSGWDLTGAIMKTASSWQAPLECKREHLAIYTMLHLAQISEAEVARAFGLEPAAVYLRASRFERELFERPELQETVSAFTRRVLERLQSM